MPRTKSIDFKAIKRVVDRDPQGSLATRSSLLTRLKNQSDEESWNSFFSIYWQLIYTTAIEGGLTEDEAQEAVQETVISVCKAMPNFDYDRKLGSFKSWLLQLTYWRMRDQLRKRGQDIFEPLREEQLQPVPPELEQRWNDEWDLTVLQGAVERVKRRVDPKQFQLFDAFVIQEWPMNKICSILNTGRARVYVAKHRVGVAIRKELHYLQTKCY